MTLAYLNGDYIPLAEAKVSVLDRGFLFGDGVYEVIPVYSNEELLGCEPHLTRLDNSLKAINITPPLTQSQWLAIFSKLLTERHGETCSIYLQVTRGADDKRAHIYDHELTPTVFAYAMNTKVKTYQELCQGLKVISHDDIRWKNCFIKSIMLMPNCLIMQSAKQQGCQEAILIRDGKVKEGCSSNLFVVKDDVIYTPPCDGEILPGITRNLILDMLQANNINYQETDISPEQLRNADEIWLTSSTKELAPIIELDGNTIGDGKPGPMWHKIYDLFQQTYKGAA